MKINCAFSIHYIIGFETFLIKSFKIVTCFVYEKLLGLSMQDRKKFSGEML